VWTREEPCVALGVSPTTGERRRRQGDWPPAIKIGYKLFYRPDDVRAWLAKKPTSRAWRPHRRAWRCDQFKRDVRGAEQAGVPAAQPPPLELFHSPLRLCLTGAQQPGFCLTKSST
jgi:hypothetical protein